MVERFLDVELIKSLFVCVCVSGGGASKLFISSD